MDAQGFIAALQWHVDNGADEALESSLVNVNVVSMPPLGASDARRESLQLARQAHTLEALREAIAAFEGLPLKKTATNLVFGEGNPHAPIMLIGEAPGVDEDKLGKPFVGASGQLLDKILACIDLDPKAMELQKSVYLTNILNWRPPGDRTPSPAEIEVSLPFIEKHIALVKPKILIFAGGISTKALLGSDLPISKLRGCWHQYTPLTTELFDARPAPIPVMVTYHPAYLFRTPAQKKLVWQDMLEIQKKRGELGLLFL